MVSRAIVPLVVIVPPVKPVPAVIDVTVPDPLPAAAQVAVVPLDVKTWPLVPIAKRVALFVPLPIIKSPVLVTGDKALKAALAVVWPVPPLAIGKAVPE